MRIDDIHVKFNNRNLEFFGLLRYACCGDTEGRDVIPRESLRPFPLGVLQSQGRVDGESGLLSSSKAGTRGERHLGGNLAELSPRWIDRL